MTVWSSILHVDAGTLLVHLQLGALRVFPVAVTILLLPPFRGAVLFIAIIVASSQLRAILLNAATIPWCSLIFGN